MNLPQPSPARGPRAAVAVAKDTGRPEETVHSRSRGESQHSHFEIGSTHGRWDRESNSDFVITSVNVPDRLDTQEVRARAAINVPDRLDTQEVRARAAMDSSLPKVHRFHRDDIARAIRWAIAIVLLVGLGWWATGVIMPLREAISPAGVQARVGSALGVPVSVRGAELRLMPTPRLVITDLVAQSGFRLPEVSVHLSWRDLLQGLQSSTLTVGEAKVAPIELTRAEALALLQSVRRAGGLPAGVSTIRFESISFKELALLPGRYEAVLRREPTGNGFERVNLKQLDIEGRADFEVVPSKVDGGSARFAFFASQWRPGLGPAIVWSEGAAQGEFTAETLKIDSFSLGARFGNLNGAATLAWDGQAWKLSGTLRASDVSVENLVRDAAGLGDADTGATLPLRGAAKFELQVSGSGPTVAAALQRASATGPVSIAGATLVGVNLGAAASHGAAEGAGGTTRLSDLDGEVMATADGVTVRALAGKAGSLRVGGSIAVDRKLQVSGVLRPEVASPRGVAAAQVRVEGKLVAPKFR